MKTVPRLMIIDDDDLGNYITTKIIEYTKLADKIDCYNSADKAIKYLRQNSLSQEGIYPDIILMDISMYLMNGWEFLDKFDKLRIEYTHRINVFILTTSIMEKDEILARKFSCIRGFYHKPLTIPVIEDIREKVFRSKGQFLNTMKLLLQVPI
jgi:CheY-like chemotaxis protein